MIPLSKKLSSIAQDLLCSLDANPAASRLFSGDASIDEYASFLAQTFLYVRHTRPLLRRAGERLKRGGDKSGFAELFLQKANEESGHELWALSDLMAIGRPLDANDPPPRSDAVAAYVAWNHYEVNSGCALAFLGTAYVLEALSAARAGMTADNLVAKGTIPNIERGVRFLSGHGDADGGHVEALEKMLDAITCPKTQSAITLSATVTASLYRGMFPEKLKAA